MGIRRGACPNFITRTLCDFAYRAELPIRARAFNRLIALDPTRNTHLTHDRFISSERKTTLLAGTPHLLYDMVPSSRIDLRRCYRRGNRDIFGESAVIAYQFAPR